MKLTCSAHPATSTLHPQFTPRRTHSRSTVFSGSSAPGAYLGSPRDFCLRFAAIKTFFFFLHCFFVILFALWRRGPTAVHPSRASASGTSTPAPAPSAAPCLARKFGRVDGAGLEYVVLVERLSGVCVTLCHKVLRFADLVWQVQDWGGRRR